MGVTTQEAGRRVKPVVRPKACSAPASLAADCQAAPRDVNRFLVVRLRVYAGRVHGRPTLAHVPPPSRR